jgi:multiple sugar transport system permease protein
MKARQTLLFLLLAFVTFVTLVPVIWAVLTSLKNPVDAFTIPPTLIFEPTLKYHYEIWFEKGFWTFLVNSLIIAFFTVSISVPIGTMAAYALSRIQTRQTRVLLFGILAVRMFQLFDTYFIMVLALVAINQPFTIWLMRSFLLDVPIELDEAARIDGCSLWQTFVKVIVPTVRPGIVVTSLFSLLLAYNEFLFALVLTGTRTKTLPVAIAEYGGEDISYWSLSAAGAVGIMLPILLFMIFAQRHLIRGLTFGAVRG